MCSSIYSTSGSFTCSGTNNAACVSINAPDSVTVSQIFNVGVTMSNNGTKLWNSDATPYHLGSQDPQDNGIWGLGRVGYILYRKINSDSD